MITKKQKGQHSKLGKFKLVNKLAIGVVISLGLFGSGALAAAQGHLQVTSKVQKMVYVNKGGKRVPTYIPAVKVLPGEILQYNTFFQNISGKAAANINIVNPIPKHTVYLPNSAQGHNTHIVFSVDGGKHYGKAGSLKVRARDGKIYPAKPSDYTHIRWQYNGSLPPKQRKAVGFKVRLL
ncbi:MAG TPA: hypothetical protein EYH16_00090 [Leucothrix mucor]|nr:hypothetical protein [Leucothrix mucor]